MTTKNKIFFNLPKELINRECNKKCRKLGGKWNSYERHWEFLDLIADQVEELKKFYSEDIIAVEITVTEEIIIFNGPVEHNGHVLASAYGRDTGATLREGVAMIAGEVGSCGSVKNWRTYADEGTVFRCRMPRAVAGLDKQYEFYTIKELT